jgi:tetratricopeptide (TPR) repeat protein
MWTLCDSLSWTALGLVLSGASEEARSVSEEALELSRRLGHRGGEILAHRAWLATEALRDLDLAIWEQGVRRDIELCESINSPWSSQGYAWLGSVVQMRGRVEEARGYLDRALEIEPVSAFAGLARAYSVLNDAYTGDRDAYVAAIEQARPGLPGGPDEHPWGSKILAFNIAQGAAFLGLEDVAGEIHVYVLEAGKAIPLGFFDGALARRIAGMTATLLRRWDEAEEHFAVARQQAIDFKMSVEPHQVEHWYGKMLLDRGQPEDRDRAREMIGWALEWYRGVGMPLHAAMAEELLKS